MNVIDDTELLRRFADRGDPADFEVIYRRHAAAVHRVCRALLRDATDAHDATHDAFLRAMRAARSHRGTGAVRPWLLRIGLNAARDLRRRPRRAVGGAAPIEEIPDGWPPVEEIAHREESAASLARELDALPPALREPLVLRYFEELDLSEIASVLEVPRSTVHARCQRGLSRLRGRLRDRESARWVTALEGACAGLLREGSGTASSLLTFAGALTVSLKSSIALGVIGLALLTAWLLREDEPAPLPTGTSSGQEVENVAPEISENPTKKDSEVGFETSPFTEAPPSDGAGTSLRGRIVDARQQGIADAVVSVRRHRGWWERGWLEAVEFETKARTDAKGRFHARLPRGAEVTTLEVTAHAARYAAATETRPLAPGATLEDEIVLELDRLDATLAGRVLGPADAPLAGAEVAWGKGRTTTDSQGRYELRVASGRRINVNAFARGAGNQTRVLDDVAPGRRLEVDFRLGEGWGLEGRVVDDEGAGIANALVRGFGPRRFEVRSDAQGAFSVHGLSRRRERTVLLVEARGRIKRLTVVAREVPVARPVIALEAGFAFEGLVVDGDGRPVPGATAALGQGLDEVRTLKTLSNVDGGFRFDAAPKGRHELHVLAPGFAEAITTASVPTDEPQRVVLERGRALLGRVVGPQGIPVSGASIQVRLGSWYAAATARSDGEGRFELPNLPAGVKQLEVRAEGYRNGDFDPRFDGGRHDYALERGARIHGRVVADRDGAPVTAFTLRLVSPDLGPDEEAGTGYAAALETRGRHFSRTDGSWEIDDQSFAEGSYVGVEVSAPGFAPRRHRRVLASASLSNPPVVTRLVAATFVGGTLVDARDGSPIAEATVSWIEGDRWERLGAETLHSEPASTTTTADGAFRLEGLVPGSGVLVARHAQRPTTASAPLTLAASGRDSVRLTMRRGSRVSGLLLDAAGSPVAAAKVRLVPTAGQPGREREVRTDAAGRFESRGLEPGLWSIAWWQDFGNRSMARLRRRFTVADDETQVVLRPEGAGRLRLRVESSRALPTDLWVAISPRGSGDDWLWRCEPLERADQTLENLGTGRHRIMVHSFSDPMRSAAGVVELRPGKVAQLTLELDASGR